MFSKLYLYFAFLILFFGCIATASAGDFGIGAGINIPGLVDVGAGVGDWRGPAYKQPIVKATFDLGGGEPTAPEPVMVPVPAVAISTSPSPATRAIVYEEPVRPVQCVVPMPVPVPARPVTIVRPAPPTIVYVREPAPAPTVVYVREPEPQVVYQPYPVYTRPVVPVSYYRSEPYYPSYSSYPSYSCYPSLSFSFGFGGRSHGGSHYSYGGSRGHSGRR